MRSLNEMLSFLGINIKSVEALRTRAPEEETEARVVNRFKMPPSPMDAETIAGSTNESVPEVSEHV